MSSPNTDVRMCPACEQWIPAEQAELHLAGMDGMRPECPRQDLYEIVKLANARDSSPEKWIRTVW
jgi:hypothetical protein